MRQQHKPLTPTPVPPYPETLGNKDEGRRGAERGRKRRSCREEECTLQWVPHSGAVAPRCVNAAECFQFLSTLSPLLVRANRTNERRRVTAVNEGERKQQHREDEMGRNIWKMAMLISKRTLLKRCSKSL